MSLFPESLPPRPLAERMRPKSIDEVLGQKDACHLLNAYVDQGEMPSLVFWGPPGSGKTTFSRLMASLLGWEGRSLNATSASVKDIRDLAKEARDMWQQIEKRTLLFIDEIHRLNKTQQDVLLPFVEAGTVVLAGSTTENPYFSITGALRSRVQLVRLHPLSVEDVRVGIKRGLASEEMEMSEEAIEWIAVRSAGDLRLAFTVLESSAILARAKGRGVTLEDVAACLDQTRVAGDRKGDNHYDLASAFQKSLRGSDPNASVYYLARFLATGEDPRFLARRLLVTAAEDVGNADPRALQLATDAFKAVEMLGMPECRIPLAQATLYLARAPKSNEAVTAVDAASKLLKARPLDPVPIHLRDSHYEGAADLDHGKGYIYSHDQPGAQQTFLPEAIKDQVFTSQSGKGQGQPDERSKQWLLTFLEKEFGASEWFEIDAEAVSQKIQWPVNRVRAALNGLVMGGKVRFKRSFCLLDGESNNAQA